MPSDLLELRIGSHNLYSMSAIDVLLWALTGLCVFVIWITRFMNKKRKTLILCAMKEEADLLQIDDEDTRVIITGIFEHNATAALAVQDEYKSNNIGLVINIGSCGIRKRFREDLRKGEIGEVFFVSRTTKYDCSLPFDGHEADMAPLDLCTPPGFPNQTCATGGQFSEGEHGADAEDMELYGLATLCNKASIPFVSIKYGSNFLGACDAFTEGVSKADRQRLLEATRACLIRTCHPPVKVGET